MSSFFSRIPFLSSPSPTQAKDGPKEEPQKDLSNFLELPEFKKSSVKDRRGHLIGGFRAAQALQSNEQKRKTFNDHAMKVFTDTSTRDPLSNLPVIFPRCSYAKVGESDWKPDPQRDDQTPRKIFDNLFKISGSEPQQEKHRAGISAVAYGLLNILALTLDRADNEKDINGTSPYLDLSPIYGPDPLNCPVRSPDKDGEIVDTELYEDSHGRNDVPYSQVARAILFLFVYNHNRLASELKAKSSKWRKPSGLSDSDAIFKAARVINCKQFMNVVLHDFMKGLVGISMVGAQIPLDLDQHQSEKISNYRRYVTSWALYHHPAFFPVYDDDKEEPKLGTNDKKDIRRILVEATSTRAGQPRASNVPEQFRDYVIRLIEKGRSIQLCSFNAYRQFLGLERIESFQNWSEGSAVHTASTIYNQKIDNMELVVGLLCESSINGGKKDGFGFGYTMTFALLVDLITTIRADPVHQVARDLGVEEWCKVDASIGNGSGLGLLMLQNLGDHYTYNSIFAHFALVHPDEAVTALKQTPKQDVTVLATMKPTVDYDTISPNDFSDPLEITSLETISYITNNPHLFKTTYQLPLKHLTNGYGYMLGFDDKKHHDLDQMMTLYALLPNKRALSEYSMYFSHLVSCRLELRHRETNNEVDVAKDVIIPACAHWACDQIFGLKEFHDPSLWVRSQNNPQSQARDGSRKDFDEKLQGYVEKFTIFFTYVFQRAKPEHAFKVQKDADSHREELFKILQGELDKAKTDSNTLQQLSEYLTRIFMELWSGFPVKGQASQESFLQRIAKGNNSSVGNFDHVYAEHVRRAHDQALKQATSSNQTSKDDIKKFLKSTLQVFSEEKKAKEERQKVETQRIIANVLGLAVVASVNLASACIQIVDFYLERPADLTKLQTLCSTDVKEWKTQGKREVMGYCREAQRIGQPFSLFRVYDPDSDRNEPNLLERDIEAKTKTDEEGTAPPDKSKNNNAQGSNAGGDRHTVDDPTPPPTITLDGFDVPQELKGLTQKRLLRLNFGKAHNSHPYTDFEKDRPRLSSLLGLGFHKCPGVSFVEEIMPEIVGPIFALKGLSRKTGFTKKEAERMPYHNIFIDEHGESVLPRSLKISYNELSLPTRVAKWDVRSDDASPVLKTIKMGIDMIMVLGILKLLWGILMSLTSTIGLEPHTSVIGMDSNLVCRPPTTIFQKWTPNTFLPGSDGNPMPAEYTLEHSRPHRLSIVDLDARDMLMSISIDGVPSGVTSDFELDKYVQCGYDYASCIHQNFSGGVVVVPPGRHTIQIAWAGKEFVPGTRDMNWGGDYSRRFGWQLEYCS